MPSLRVKVREIDQIFTDCDARSPVLKEWATVWDWALAIVDELRELPAGSELTLIRNDGDETE